MNRPDMMWSMLVHLGLNINTERGNTNSYSPDVPRTGALPYLNFSRETWDGYLLQMKAAGVNTIVLELAEGLRYESHPELAVEGSWTREEMEAELKKLRAMGFEVVPKLNFSATHDEWMGEYSRMVSTPTYYKVCADLIHEVCDIFKPKYFHLGMDEETPAHQELFYMSIVRQYDLWWHDLLYLVELVEKENVRAWIWSDMMWYQQATFLKKMPKSVLQSNWYYYSKFDREWWEATVRADKYRVMKNLECFDILEANGYDQVPTGSNYYSAANMELLTRHCADRIAPERLLGFMQTPWKHTTPENAAHLAQGVETLKQSKDWFYSR